MAVETDRAALAALARAVSSAAGRATQAEALADLAEVARRLAGAEVALVRVAAGGDERLEAVAVAGPAALAAELDGTLLPAAELPAGPVSELAEAPQAVRQAAARAAAGTLLLLPVRVDDARGSLELYRAGGAFSADERAAADFCAGQAALLLRVFAGRQAGVAASLARPALELAGEALAAGLAESHTASEVARVAASVVGAPVGLLWQLGTDGALELGGAYGLEQDADLGPAAELAATALENPAGFDPVESDRLPGRCSISTTLPLGQPPVGLLQLLFSPGSPPTPEQLVRLTTFAVRAAHALRSNERALDLQLELERTRALLAVVGQATAELSLAHTLETALERVSELLAVETVSVYLRADSERLVAAAARGLAGPHARVAERLLDLALGPARARRFASVADAASDDRLRDVRDAAREAGIEAALAAPLFVRDDVIGLLAVYPERGRAPTENEAELLTALAAQLAVAVQNAQLHERSTQLGRERQAALESERAAARRLGALYEISRSFAQSLSLDETLDALASTVVDVLDVDAALIGLPDERREQLEPRAMHVADSQLADAAHAILYRPEPFGSAHVQRLFRDARPFRVMRGHELLEPFLARGWTAAVVPVATPAEVIAALTILSFRPGAPVTDETVESAVAIAGQAALAIDNARLYQQQKQFADTMQRSMLPRERPAIAGLEVGELYESSARVDVGGDIYDFLELGDGRLAVVLGDVTGHGVEATADMAMAKFVFRSLAREHPEPGEFLAAANDVVVGEIAPGKFITMTYVAVDAARGVVSCASAGHPPPRLLLPDGTVAGLEAAGLVLGIEGAQRYEEVRAELPPGAAIVLYTDGVIEARRGGELYGVERLDGLLAERRELPVRTLARAVAEDCRSFAGGELGDDVAVVVIRRTP